MSLRAGVVGFRGYSGAELVAILQRHPSATPILLEHRDAAHTGPKHLKSAGPPAFACTPEAIADAKLDVVFLATPPEASMELSPWLLDAGLRVIDLSGAFRLRTPERYKAWYKADHTQPALARRSGLWATGILPRSHSRREADLEPRVLSDRRESRNPAAYRGGMRRPVSGHRVRCQVRGERRRTQAQSHHQLLRGDR